MNRFLARTAAATFCVAWIAGCSSDDAARTADLTPAPTAAATDADTIPDLPPTLDGEIARAHGLRLKGDYVEAVKALAQLMIVAPDDVRVVGEYGKAMAQEGRPADALPFLKRAIQLQSNDWTLYSALGVACDQSDDHAGARRAYEQALALKPGQPDVLNNYAVSRMLAGDLDGARRLLAQASLDGGKDAKVSKNLALLDTMQAQPHATPTPVVQASLPPAHDGGATRFASLPLHPSGVEMQQVPSDPMAGPAELTTPSHKPVHRSARAKTKLAAAKAKHPANAPMLRTAATKLPTLRTAADGQ